MIISKVGRRGRITLPRAIRRMMNLAEGDRVAFIRQGDGVILQPLTQTLLDLRGSIPVSDPQDFEIIHKQTFADQARKLGTDEH